jgi:3-phytase
VISALLILVACGRQGEQDLGKFSKTGHTPVIMAAWLSDRNEADNVDSPAVWHGHDGQDWIISTCKTTDRLLIHNAHTGVFLRSIGEHGDGSGQFRRPNGIAIIDDLAIIVERDNHRVQMFHLPEWTSLGSFGMEQLIKPYGVAVRRSGESLMLYVTDNYEGAEDDIPADSLLGERVKMFAVHLTGGSLQTEYRGAFGATQGVGVLRVVESIAVDSTHQRLLIADENPAANDIKVYDLEGNFTGSIVGKGRFLYQPEGIVLYACDDGSGYWIATDQDEADNTFHIFDRRSFDYLVSFKAAGITNTDGIALSQHGIEGFPDGLFVAVHNDGNVGVLSWQSIADSLSLPLRCSD